MPRSVGKIPRLGRARKDLWSQMLWLCIEFSSGLRVRCTAQWEMGRRWLPFTMFSNQWMCLKTWYTQLAKLIWKLCWTMKMWFSSKCSDKYIGWERVYVYVYIYIYIYVRLCGSMYMYISMRLRMYLYMYINTDMYICMYIYIYTIFKNILT